MGGDTGDREPRPDLDEAKRRSKYPHEPDMSWDEIEDRLRTADQAAVYQVFAFNERLGDLVARNGEELSQLRAALADAQAEIARLRAAVGELHAPDGESFCAGCSWGRRPPVSWPCRTVRLLAAAPAPAPKAGDRLEDGGQMGTLVRCDKCGGGGLLHDPDELPPTVEPLDPAAPAPAEDERSGERG